MKKAVARQTGTVWVVDIQYDPRHNLAKQRLIEERKIPDKQAFSEKEAKEVADLINKRAALLRDRYYG